MSRFKESGHDSVTRLLRRPPPWINRTHALLYVALCVSVIILVRARVDDHLRGPAVVRLREGHYEVIAWLPSSAGSALRPGLPMALTLRQSPKEPHQVLVDTIEPPSSPGQPRIVHARLPAPDRRREDDGPVYEDGMTGDAEIVVRSTRRLLSVVPGLERVVRP